MFVTVAISYFVPVESAPADARRLGAYVSSLGESREEVLGVTLLRWGMAPDDRPDPVSVEPLNRAIGRYLDTVQAAFVGHVSGPLPSAGLGAIRDLGVPAVDDEAFRAALDDQVSRRCQLARMLVDGGWFPEAWERRMEAISSHGKEDAPAG